MPNALNLKDFLEHFELTLLSILHPRYNSIPAENRMGDTISFKITDKALYIQHLDRSRTTAMDGGSADIAGANTCRPPWMGKCRFCICPWMDGSRTTHMYRMYGSGAMQELLPRSSTPVDLTDLFRIIVASVVHGSQNLRHGRKLVVRRSKCIGNINTLSNSRQT